MTRLFAIVLGALVVALTAQGPRQGAFDHETLIPDARAVRLAAKSHISLVTDLYWIRMASLAVAAKLPYQALGLLKWGEFVTDLDPRFFWAYVVGGMLGPVDVNGEIFNAARAAALLEKGTRNLPEEYRLNMYLAYTNMNLLHDYTKAGLTLRDAVSSPGAPKYLGALATRLLANAGEFEVARDFARAMSESDDPVMRETFTRRLKELDREQLLVSIEAAAKRFAEVTGHPATSVDELIGAHFLEYPTVDPLGGVLTLLPDGGVHASSGERLRVTELGGSLY